MTDTQLVQRESTSSATPSSMPSSGAGAAAGGGLRSALRGASYADGAAMLSPVQMKGGGDSEAVHQAAADGIKGSGGAMPHGAAIQRSFGGYDISNVQAHTDAGAQNAASRMGADAYATGNHVAFGKSPDLHTAAHEAAHVVQQKAGVQLSGGVGAVGDKYEQHADQVADAVVQGKSAEPLLAKFAGGAGGDGVQMKRKGGGGGVGGKKSKKGGGETTISEADSETESTATRGKGSKLGEGRDAKKDEALEADIEAKMKLVPDDRGGKALKRSPNSWLKYSVATLKMAPSPIIRDVNRGQGKDDGSGEQPAIQVYLGLPARYQASFLEAAIADKAPTLILFRLGRERDDVLKDKVVGKKDGKPTEGDGNDLVNDALRNAIKERDSQLSAIAGKLARMLGVPQMSEVQALKPGQKMAPPQSRAASTGECASFVSGMVAARQTATLMAYGEEAWEVLVLAKRATADEKPYVKNMGKALFDLCHAYQGAEAAAKKAGNKKEQGIQGANTDTIRNFGTPWGDATAALGLDPMGKKITDTLSVRSDEYNEKTGADDTWNKTHMVEGGGEKSGKEILSEYKEKLEEKGEDVNVWSDMFLPWGMWSMAGNITRYLDTDVHLLSGEKGSRLNKAQVETVTSMEVHVGKSLTAIDQNQKVTENMFSLEEYVGLGAAGDPTKILSVGPGGFEYREDGTVTRNGRIVKEGANAAVLKGKLLANQKKKSEKAKKTSSKKKR